ncbi:MAG: M20/M25/M40 family metallo-hydrolase [Oscillospiraceae bacterium]|nr:M20/M25/M40 family metallo-hydrolase [Oscillospiraceae bacterium]
MWWLILPGVIVAFLALICIRAAAFKPKTVAPPPTQAPLVPIDSERAIENFQAMIVLETLESNPEARAAFRDLLPARYPLVHQHCTREVVGEGGLLYHWKGKSSEGPTVYLSHYDVVPVEADKWQKEPFSAARENGEIWGRGTLDTKATLLAALESAETLLATGFVPARDIYFSFGGNEEVTGHDAEAIVDLLESRGVRPALVLDEGGAVVQGIFPGVKAPVAVIGTGEKGLLNVNFSAQSTGGHASAPPKSSLIAALSKAVLRVEKRPFKARLSPPVRQMFDTLGRHSTFAYKLIFANLWCFEGLFTSLCKVMGGEINALVRTTVAFTQMQGSDAINVLPPSASIKANLRLMVGDSPEAAMAYLKSCVKDESVTVTNLEGDPASAIADIETEGYGRVQDTIRTMWPEALVSPYLMFARTDSRYFCRISDVVLRFSAMEMSKEDRARIHAHDERISEGQLLKAVEFYQRLIAAS